MNNKGQTWIQKYIEEAGEKNKSCWKEGFMHKKTGKYVCASGVGSDCEFKLVI